MSFTALGKWACFRLCRIARFMPVKEFEHVSKPLVNSIDNHIIGGIMQKFKINPDISFLAATPQTADNEFITMARSAGIKLYQIMGYDYSGSNALTLALGKYFAAGLPPAVQIVATKNEYLVLPIKNNELQVNDYFSISAPLFETIFIPGNDQAKPEPADPPETSQKLKGKSFYLDAGHGGTDPGAVNNNLNLQEKIAALDVCLDLGKFLEKQGADIYYSRTDSDTYPALSKRASDANNLNVNAFISIHLNSAQNKSAAGAETLVYSNKGTAYELAKVVQANMVLATGFKDRGVKERPDLAVLKLTKMPAILAEIGFISNDDEARKLFTRKYQIALAEAIGKGVMTIFGEK